VTISRRRQTFDGEISTTLGVEGDIDSQAAPLLAEALQLAIERDPLVYCDLTKAVFFSAAGAHVLHAADHHGKALGNGMVLHGVHGVVLTILRMGPARCTDGDRVRLRVPDVP
jgi:anti-anti-sigma regulatory factor